MTNSQPKVRRRGLFVYSLMTNPHSATGPSCTIPLYGFCILSSPVSSTEDILQINFLGSRDDSVVKSDYKCKRTWAKSPHPWAWPWVPVTTVSAARDRQILRPHPSANLAKMEHFSFSDKPCHKIDRKQQSKTAIIFLWLLQASQACAHIYTCVHTANTHY